MKTWRPNNAHFVEFLHMFTCSKACYLRHQFPKVWHSGTRKTDFILVAIFGSPKRTRTKD